MNGDMELYDLLDMRFVIILINEHHDDDDDDDVLILSSVLSRCWLDIQLVNSPASAKVFLQTFKPSFHYPS